MMAAQENTIKLKIFGDKTCEGNVKKIFNLVSLFFFIQSIENWGEVCETEHNSDWGCRRLRDRHLATKRVGFSQSVGNSARPVPPFQIWSDAVRVVGRDGDGGDKYTWRQDEFKVHENNKYIHNNKQIKMPSLTAMGFVAAVITIVVEIATPMQRDTTSISTLKLRRTARR